MDITASVCIKHTVKACLCVCVCVCVCVATEIWDQK